MTIEDVIQSICDEQHDCRWMDTADFEKCLRRVAAEQKKIDTDKAVIWVDENVGSLTAIALRKHLEG